MPEEAALPEFAVAMRGYDRLQVDDYIVKQAEWLDEARSRMETAEQGLVDALEEARQLREQVTRLEQERFTSTPQSFGELGERVGRLLQAAWDSAEELRADAERTAADLVRSAEEKLAGADDEIQRRANQAERKAEASAAERHARLASEAEALVAEARKASEEIQARAHEEAERVTAEASRLREEMQAEITRLEEQRDSALAELARLRSSLEDLFSSVSVAQEADGAETIDLRETRVTETDTPERSGAATGASRRVV